MDHFRFINDCQTGFTCSEGQPTHCWCEMDWDDTSYWQTCVGVSWSNCSDESPPVSFPDYHDEATEHYEHVRIEHSTTDSRCNGGLDHATLCNDDGDCRKTCDNPSHPTHNSNCTSSETRCVNAGGTCEDHFCEPEQFLLINLTKDGSGQAITITDLTIKAESSGTLYIRLESGNDPLDPPPVSESLTTTLLYLDGINGGVTVKVADFATLAKE